MPEVVSLRYNGGSHFAVELWVNLLGAKGLIQNHFLLSYPDEDYGRDSGPPSKKIRSSPREAKNKRRSGKNSQEDR